MDLKKRLQNERLILDGGMGTLLQQKGLPAGSAPELWNLERPEEITAIHQAYYAAGADIVTMNTFGVNALKYDDDTVEKLISAAFSCAQKARLQSDNAENKYIALDIGPTGKLLEPLGSLSFEEAVRLFAQIVRIGAKCGADLILVETMSDAYETKAAVLAAKENCNLPIIATNAYNESAQLMTGADIPAMVALLEGLGVNALGMNCSLGPKQLQQLLPAFLQHSSLPVAVVPNAGLPRSDGGTAVYDISPSEFADCMAEMAASGARILGGCCGTTPEYIAAIKAKVQNLPVLPISNKGQTVVSSYTHAVFFGDDPVLIGERINPTGKAKLKAALRSGDMGYLLNEGLAQQKSGAQILDVNVGLPEIDEPAMMCRAVSALQSVVDAPLQIDTSDPIAMGSAMRLYNGKPLINSVNGKQSSMEQVFPLIQKYGGTVIALTMDENGIPDTARGRCQIAAKIAAEAEKYGIGKKDIIVDPLALTVSSDENSANVTLEAIRLIRSELNLKVSLGVSNISFGLPNRPTVNAAFFAMALESGLNCAIMNPFSTEMMGTYYAYRLLRGMDPGCKSYLAYSADSQPAAPAPHPSESSTTDTLKQAVISGLCEAAQKEAAALIGTADPLDIINKQIIPALDTVGSGFESGRLFLPQLLMSAEAAQAAFTVIRGSMPPSAAQNGKKIVLATVHGDIHDIGKNIVKVLLENFGFTVIDLGKDVPPEQIAAAVQEHDCKLVGLSALMTTTVPAMEKTIRLLNAAFPNVKTVVGGAVLTQEYADRIGADFYARDAMETVRYAQRFFG